MTTASGVSKCNFTIAVQRRFANAQGVKEADFIPVVAWRGLADLCASYLCKGRKVAVEGSIQTRSYDAQDGSRRWVTEIIAESVEFLFKKEGGEQAQATSNDGYTEVPDDELPY